MSYACLTWALTYDGATYADLWWLTLVAMFLLSFVTLADWIAGSPALTEARELKVQVDEMHDRIVAEWKAGPSCPHCNGNHTGSSCWVYRL